MDLRGVFNSVPKSLFDTISEPGSCFYLPAYQRPYSWSKPNIERVFEDVLHGLSNSIRNEDAITFIGTLLTIHDTKHETIVPHKKDEVPSRVMLVIDGQQRLSTFLLIITALHNELKLNEQVLSKQADKIQKELNNDLDDEDVNKELDNISWLLDKVNQEIANLNYFSTDTNANRDPVFRYYPKLIRAYLDCWSKTEDGAKYESPIARYLFAYNKHVLSCHNDQKHTRFNYSVESTHRDFDKHQVLIKNLRSIKSHITKISKNNFDAGEFPDLEALMTGKFRESFQFEIPEAYLVDSYDNHEINKALNLIVFTKYLLNRVCVTYVTVTDETYAFDMFEALNTTGEPLTSIETFKPKVVEEEGLSSYESSESKKYFDVIDSYLDSIPDAGKKHKATTRIMLSFALSETGEQISKHISDQRKYLLESYRDEEPSTKRSFVKNLSYVTRFYYEEWDKEIPTLLTDSESEANILLLCLDVLRKSNHEITVPLLARYYNQMLESPNDEEAKKTFIKAIKIIVSFFVLWRASHTTTSGIDAVYRQVLRSGDSELGIEGFSRRSQDKLSIKPLSLVLRRQLQNKLGAKDENLKEVWLKSSYKNPIYNISLPLTRLMMLAAFHDTCPSTTNIGMVEKASAGSSVMLSWHKWKLFNETDSDKRFTVEHIAPQTLTDSWDQSLVDDHELIDTIGNLTILPCRTNSSASNKSWDEKKKYYTTLCQDSQRKKEELLGAFTENQQQILLNSQYLGFLSPISTVDNWNSDLIRKRSNNLLSQVWDVLIEWLEAD